MIEEKTLPYICHVFVCTNDRHGERKSCADGNSSSVLSLLKDAIAEQGWKGRVRVSQSGCLGLCMKGPNVLLYPQKIWFSSVAESDVPDIMKKIELIVAE
ncbi:MAG: (2Fe-2S) ferredoxin domain-containing protein [Candidatus Kuenenia sp.]|nr:(2Fe-2S) ferredoxin domain-containing protein [Candidatus Kuenenia hertensis]